MAIVRIIAGIALGIALGIGCVLLGDWINMQLFPPPPPQDWLDYSQNAPVYKLIALPITYTIAAFIAALAAAKIGARIWAGWVAGGVLTAATFANLVVISHPRWMTILCVVCVPLAAWFGARLAR